MTSPLRDGQEYSFQTETGDWVGAWHPPTFLPPAGKRHGSAAVCVAPDRQVVLISEDNGQSWKLPGGRPEGNETWRETLVREVAEEACASVDEATLLGFSRAACLHGSEEGLVLVRAIWRADVTLDEWAPKHETTDRVVVQPDEAIARINPAGDRLSIYMRIFNEAFANE